MSEDYSACSYRELQKMCRQRNLGGKGSKDALVSKLMSDDLKEDSEDEQPTIATDRGGYSLRPSDPDPHNPRWDRAGRWIRTGCDGRPLHKAYRDKSHPAYKNFEDLRKELGDDT
jgi:hypothetical protein